MSNIPDMKRYLVLFFLLLCAKMAHSEELPLQRTGFTDNWSVAVSAGAYHPMLFPMKYLADCSGWMGSIEVRKQLMPALAFGVEANGYLRLDREQRKDPRTVIGPAMYLNISRLIQGYTGCPRFFEVEAMLMPAWGHVYRGTSSAYFPDENYFAVKFGADFRFALGKEQAWTLGIRPAMVYDLSVAHGNQYESFDINHADLQLSVGVTYHLRGLHKRPRHIVYAKPLIDHDEIDRLNDIINYLRQDVQQRDDAIARIQALTDSLTGRNTELEQRLQDAEKRKGKALSQTSAQYETLVSFPDGQSSMGQGQMYQVEAISAFLKEHPRGKVTLTAAPNVAKRGVASDLAERRLEALSRAISIKTGVKVEDISQEVKSMDGWSGANARNDVKVIVVEHKSVRPSE